MMAASRKNERRQAGARRHGRAEDDRRLPRDQPVIGCRQRKADTANYNKIQAKSAELIGNAKNIAQFLDRDTSPDFVSNVIGDAFATFVADPTQVTRSVEHRRAEVHLSQLTRFR